jgi:enoyl-CoA hydratase
MLTNSPIIHERNSTLALIRLNRPDKLNALSHDMFEAFNQQLSHLENDDELRVVIITGTADRAFCAGTDITELTMEKDAIEISERGQRLCDRIENFPVPVIAAINGIAAGGGLELALACHLRVASSEANFSLPETKLGLIPAYGGTQRLTRELGVGHALEVMLTGRTMSSQEAFEFGLINRVVPSAKVLSEAISLAEEIAKLSPLSIRACLKAVIQGLELPLDKGLKLETELFSSLFATEDAREGLLAFLEKRAASFKGQ